MRGPGGYTAAFRAAQLGLRVALVDEDKIGGTCLHRGCIPTKALLESAEVMNRAHHLKDYGVIFAGEPTVDYAQMAVRRDQVVKRMWTGPQDPRRQEQGRLGPGPRQARGSGQGPRHPDRRRGRRDRLLQATDIILATGSRVKSLAGLTPDGKRILTSDDILRRADAPKSIVIVGGGAVGVEFASFFHDIGTTVTLLEYLPAIVPLEDREVSALVEKSFTRRGIRVITKARFDPAKVQVTKDGVCVDVGPEGGATEEIKAEVMLVATGRAANVEDIGLETTRVEVDKGVVKVNGRMRTREPHIYAIGDMIGGLWLAHVAGHEGLIAAHVIAGDKDVHEMDYVKQPRATYCRPEIASIGLTTQQCEEQGLPTKVGKMPFQAIAKALVGGEYEGFVKVIGHAETDDTLGIHIVGPHATDLIAEASVAFSLDATPWEIGAATHAHPTLAEAIGEAAMAVDGRSINF